MPKTKLTPFLLLVSCGVALCTLNATAAVAQELPSLPQPIEETVVAQPALLDQLRAGTMTAEEAWDKKLLDEKGALALLEGGLGSIEGGNQDRDLRVALVSVLMKHSPQRIEVTVKTSLRLKRALADYYASLDDEHAVALYEGLAARDEYSSYERGSLLRILGEFQSKQGKSQAAIATFLQARDWFVKAQQKHSIGEVLILAAREYARAGDEKKAQLLYAQVAQVSDPYMSKMALLDQIHWLGMHGKPEQMRALLEQPLAGTDKNGAKLTVLSFMARFHYGKGEFDQAREYATQAIAFRKSLPTAPKALALEEREDMAEEVLEWSQRWQKLPVPIFADPQELRKFVKPGDKPLVWQLAIRSLYPVTATVTSPSDQIKIRPITQKPTYTGLCYSNIVELEIAAADIDTALIVQIPQHPELQIRVPIVMEMQRTGLEQETIDTIVVE